MGMVYDLMIEISIHAPRGGSDDSKSCCAATTFYFNPRSPWGERLSSAWSSAVQSVFQSTLPVGGATRTITSSAGEFAISIHAPRGGSDSSGASVRADGDNFNPRSPWGERLSPLYGWHISDLFQSTLPVGGATFRFPKHPHPQSYFNPRSPWGERRESTALYFPALNISIHAPRGGSDRFSIPCYDCLIDFNPRSPWGERRYVEEVRLT